MAGDIDSAVISMRLANGALAVIENSRQAVFGYDQRIEVFGSKGGIEAFNETPARTVLRVGAGFRHENPLYFFLERYQRIAADNPKTRLGLPEVKLGLLPGALTPSLVESVVRVGTWLPFAPAACRPVACRATSSNAPSSCRPPTWRSSGASRATPPRWRRRGAACR